MRQHGSYRAAARGCRTDHRRHTDAGWRPDRITVPAQIEAERGHAGGVQIGQERREAFARRRVLMGQHRQRVARAGLAVRVDEQSAEHEAVGGRDGARDAVANIIAEFDLTLGLSGLTSVKEITTDAVTRT